jgi:hypothetical protein
MGLNNSGHVLILATDATGGCPWMLWIWDGAGSAAGNFSEITPVNNAPSACGLTYLIRFDGSHLNDKDHIALVSGPRDWATCPDPLSAGILANGTFAPLIPLQPASGIIGIAALNNHEQLLAFDGANAAPGAKLWDGASLVDLGLTRGSALNDLGHVLFSAHPGGIPRIYKNGAATDVPVPTALPGFVLQPGGAVGTGGINSVGQVLLSMMFEIGGPFAISHPVLLTPNPPTVTLKVNGQHPTPPVVTTTGPMALTLDLSASAYTAPLSWYWGLIVNNQLVWITATGLSATPAPLVVAPPVAITNATLLNTTLSPGTTLAALFLLVDSGGSAVAFDIVAATRP